MLFIQEEGSSYWHAASLLTGCIGSKSFSIEHALQPEHNEIIDARMDIKAKVSGVHLGSVVFSMYGSSIN